MKSIATVVSDLFHYRFVHTGRWMRMSLDQEASRRPEARILWVSAEPEPRMQELLDRMGATWVESVSSGLECCQAAGAASYSAIVANFPLPDCAPDELLVEIRRVDPSVSVLIRDAPGSLSGAIRLANAGADHVFGADFDPDEVARRIEGARELRYRRELV